MKKILLALAFSFGAQAQSNLIRLHLLPPTQPLDWTTPRTLFMSALKNRWEGGGRPFGHVYTEIHCGQKKIVTSTRSKKFNPISEFVNEGRGLGILYHTYEGELEEGPTLEKELAGRAQEGKMLSLTYTINEKQCSRMMTYLDEYRGLNVGRAYGLPHRPLFAEGGTDVAFAVSFLDVAGILQEKDREEWWGQVNIPLDYSGPPLKDETVNFIRVLFGATEWAMEKDKHRKLQFYDIQKMYAWIGKEIQSKRHSCSDEKVRGICFDMSYLPVKQGPIWRQYTDPMYLKKKPTSL
jgi:hypothetical protein